jgi:spermidine/putrescine transport system substrate-binding protein
MSMTPVHPPQHPRIGRLTRREVLSRAARLALLPAVAPILSACSSDSDTATSTGATSATGTSASPDQLAGDLLMSNWKSWMGNDVVSNFEAEYPDTSVQLHAPLGSSIAARVQQWQTGGFDLALADLSNTGQALAIGLVAEPEFDKIPNIGKVDKSFSESFPHGIPTDYGKVGILYRPDIVGETIASWADVWRLAQKVSGQVVFLDVDRDTLGSALKYLGYSVNTTSEDELAEARDALIQIKPYLQAFGGSGQLVPGLVNGSIAIAMAYDFDYTAAAKRQADIEWVSPTEGMAAYLEGWIALDQSDNLDLAWAFMNFGLEPEQYADFVNVTGAAYVEQEAEQFIDPDIVSSPALAPDPAVLETVEYEDFLGDATTAWSHAWEEVKAAS